MTDVFFSCSRKDRAFVQTLHSALLANKRDIRVDWEDIPPSANWRAEIYAAIEQADSFPFVLSPDGSRLVVVAWDGMISVRDTRNGERLFFIDGLHGSLSGLAFNPDGKSFVTSADGSAMILWSIETGEPLVQWAAPGRVADILYSPDGSLLATGSFDNTFILWNADTGQKLTTLYGNSGGINDLNFNYDRTKLATASADNFAIVYLVYLEDLIELALTRTLTDEECEQYLHIATCP